MKTFNDFLKEMALDVGEPYSFIHSSRTYSKHNYNNTKNHPVIKELSKNVKLHMNVDGKATTFTVNDHNTGETLYDSSIVHRNATDEIPFRHIEQTSVDRTKSSDVLPKNFATDFIYNHWKSQKLPLRSSDMQFRTGRDMWSRLIDKAHSDGKYTFFIDENSNKKQITSANKDEFMKKYFGKYDVHKKRHLVLSHTNDLHHDI